MRSPWVVLEIYESTASNAIACEDFDAAVEVFSRLVSEYGVEPYEDLINSKMFMDDDGFVVQMVELKHSSPTVRLGTLNVETDWDFSLELNGTVFSDSEFSIDIDSMDQLEAIKVMGPFGSPSGGKQWEILDALKAIKANPNEFFSNQGGNRGAMWHPKQQ